MPARRVGLRNRWIHMPVIPGDFPLVTYFAILTCPTLWSNFCAVAGYLRASSMVPSPSRGQFDDCMCIDGKSIRWIRWRSVSGALEPALNVHVCRAGQPQRLYRQMHLTRVVGAKLSLDVGVFAAAKLQSWTWTSSPPWDSPVRSHITRSSATDDSPIRGVHLLWSRLSISHFLGTGSSRRT